MKIVECSVHIKGSPCIGEREEEIDQYDYPVFVICPEPDFKNIQIENNSELFWYYLNPKSFDNKSVVEVYENRSYQLGKEWEIPGLKIGKNEDFGENIIEVFQIPTPHAMCVKVEYLYKMSSGLSNFIFVDVKISNQNINKWQRLNMFVSANNTWQGVIYQNWPYYQVPLKIIGNIPKPGMTEQLTVKIEEKVWKYRKGQDESISCFIRSNETTENCTSIFHPYSYQFDTRYLLLTSRNI